MITQTAWLDRKFVFDRPIGTFPMLLERLRGTPARAKELITGLPDEMLATRVNDKWSVKEHLGHLVDLEPLDVRRLSEFLNHAEILSGADIENHATESADQLELLTEEQVVIVAIHPRLQKPMRLMDWVYFVAEHDDHHLAQARRAITATAELTTSPKK